MNVAYWCIACGVLTGNFIALRSDSGILEYGCSKACGFCTHVTTTFFSGDIIAVELVSMSGKRYQLVGRQ
jgi:hypothetical protein